MNILIIDYRSPKGHEEWLKLQINCFLNLGHKVTCIIKEGYGNLSDLEDRININYIPSHLYSSKTGFLGRIFYLKPLKYINSHYRINEYDAIIYTSYEVVSLSLMPLTRKAVVINHNNVSDIEDSPIKRFFLKRIPKDFIHIAFNNSIKNKLQEFCKHQVILIPHGLLNISFSPTENILEEVGCEKFKYIFSPSMNSTEKNVLYELCESPEFNNYLRDNGIKMVLRRQIDIKDEYTPNYVFINKYLSKDEYYSLLTYSNAIIICVGNNFKYRVSGTLFECMRMNKVAFVSRNETLMDYTKYASYKMTFDNVHELVSQLEDIGHISDPYKNLEEIADPTIGWNTLLINYIK